MRAIEVDAASAPLGILARPVLDVILRPVRHLLTMYSYGAVAVHAADVVCGCICRFGNRNFLPSPFMLAVDEVFAALLASEHQIMRHSAISGDWFI
jgi:hypothetical protein